MKMASELEIPTPALREVDKLEQTRNALLFEIGYLETDYTAASIFDNLSGDQIKQFLSGISEDIGSLNRESLKDFLSNILGRVTLDPATQ